VLLYEMGKPDQPEDPPGRMQIAWLLRATTDTYVSAQWGKAADFEGVLLDPPVSRAEAMQGEEFARGPGKARGRAGQLQREVWDELVELIDRDHPGFAVRVNDPRALDIWFADPPGDVEDDPSKDEEYRRAGQPWRAEYFLQVDVARFLADTCGLASAGPTELGLRKPSRQGFWLPSQSWYVDDVVKVGRRRFVVVEYERFAHGDPAHGAQQAFEYQDELKRLRPDLRFDAAVIAMEYSAAELTVGRRLGIECLRAGVDQRGRVTLAHAGGPKGAIVQRLDRQ
jgi:hypothetical protein